MDTANNYELSLPASDAFWLSIRWYATVCAGWYDAIYAADALVDDAASNDDAASDAADTVWAAAKRS